jgi:serine/threonine-protein kinase
VVRIVSQVLSALSDAHSAGVIHRDLKPENIMVEQRRGEADFVKVLDFGIAKIMDNAGDDGPALTRAGFVCGTPEYMSPEQARGAQLDHRSDLYAVGVILYQLCSGMLPFDSDSAVGFATKHLTEQPVTPSKRRPEAKISPAMEKLIMRALSKSPDERPQTAESFRAELLALDKERRSVSTRAGSRGASGPKLARIVTPEDQTATKVTGEAAPNPWEKDDRTRKEDPAFLRHREGGPVPAGADELSTAGDRTRATGAPQMTGDLEPVSGKASGTLIKVAAAGLILLALALGGAVVWQKTRDELKVVEQPPDPVDKPLNKVPPPPLEELPNSPTWALDQPAGPRDLDGAKKLVAEADKEWSAGRVDNAATKYQLAYRKNPDAELALKLGEVYRVKKDKGASRAWWDRHMKDAKSSNATGYINDVEGQQ